MSKIISMNKCRGLLSSYIRLASDYDIFENYSLIMSIGLARYWDSLESAEYLDPCQKLSETKLDLDRCQQEWLSELSFTTEHECQSILYAKSLLDGGSDTTMVMAKSSPDEHGPQRIAVGIKHHCLSSSTGNLVPPPKPQRRIARLKTNKNETICPHSPPQFCSVPAYSTLDLIESCKFSENYASISDSSIWNTEQELRSKIQINSLSRIVMNRRSALRHTIAINQEDIEQAKDYSVLSDCPISEAPPHTSHTIPPSSPKSMHSDSTLSVDSGQCSGDVALTSQHSFSSSREEKDTLECLPIFQSYQQRCLPGYARMASTMDHVLRTSSAIYSLLSGATTPSSVRDLLAKAEIFIQIIVTSPCAQSLPKYDINVVKLQISDLQRDSTDSGSPLGITNYFTIVLRKVVEQVLQIFCRIICKYLTECGNKDRLVIIALEHLIHLTLFGDELCLEAIQSGGLNSLLKLVRQSTTPTDTIRLLLRALAVLCGVAKGCLSLLSVKLNYNKNISKQNAIIRLINSYNRQQCSTIFVQEQIVTILSRLAARRYEEAMIAQGAVPMLLEMLTVTDKLHSDYCRRIRYKVCNSSQLETFLDLYNLIYCSFGLFKLTKICICTLRKEILAYAILTHVLEMESSSANPLNMICSNIINKLESKYQIESAV
uniref:Sister chromatid cohesion protein n=1 Tax=Heterorhabditis bacteriophora TaxID=37862 RepID=A0A1I7W7D7_HETBA